MRSAIFWAWLSMRTCEWVSLVFLIVFIALSFAGDAHAIEYAQMAALTMLLRWEARADLRELLNQYKQEGGK